MPSASWVGRSLVVGRVLTGEDLVEALRGGEQGCHPEGLREARGGVGLPVLRDGDAAQDACLYFCLGTTGHGNLLVVYERDFIIITNLCLLVNIYQR